MNNSTITQLQPIADESTAERVIEQFLAGYDPLLFAGDFGLTPEQVFDQIRWTLRLYVEKALADARKLSRRGRAGRKPKPDDQISAKTKAQRKWRESKSPPT